MKKIIDGSSCDTAEEAVSDEKKKATHYFEPELLRRLKVEAAETGISATEILNDMLRERYKM